MKPAFIIVLAALSGAVAAALVMSMVPHPSMEGPPAAGSTPTVDLSESMVGVEREIRLLREELSGVREAIDRASVAGPPITSTLPPATAGDEALSAPREAVTTSSRPASTRAPLRGGPPSLLRLREVAKWDEDADYRRRWMFKSERDVLEWYGTPDQIEADGDREDWYYEVPTGAFDEDGDPVLESFTIYLNRGRMVSAEYDD
ncbi:MAG: hypothetical protein ACYTDX_06560 [Planctomycetota bacterium]